MSEDDVKKMANYMEQNRIANIDYFLSLHDRLVEFAENLYEKIQEMDRRGDLE